MASTIHNCSYYPVTPSHWRRALAELPDVCEGGKIPAFYFAHGQPLLTWPPTMPLIGGKQFESHGPRGPLAAFLRDFGPFLLKKYRPKGIITVSPHWETPRERLVTDYGAENPLLMDFSGFPSQIYNQRFCSRGDSTLSRKVVQALRDAGIPARTTDISETRGRDGRGFSAPGLDHGVFVPFRLCFGDECDVPIVQVSMDANLNPDTHWEMGRALRSLRSQGYLLLIGGSTIHTPRDFDAFCEKTAKPAYRDFANTVMNASMAPSLQLRRAEMTSLMSHPAFHCLHPREEHFIPLYIAAGAGEKGKVRVLCGLYGAPTIAFGV